MSYFMVDIEADGPIPGDYSMISIGMVRIDKDLTTTFYREIKPISNSYITEALNVSGFSREQTLLFDDPEKCMRDCFDWIEQNSKGRPTFISDNNGFDWMFVCWYFHHFIGKNPFGHSSQNLNSLYKGLQKDLFTSFKHLRTRRHTHNALEDALGNAEVCLLLSKEYDIHFK